MLTIFKQSLITPGGIGIDIDYIRRIRDLREDAELNQTQVAQILGTSQTMYSRYERGVQELPLRHLIALCRLYNVSADYLLGFTNRPNPCNIQYSRKR